MVRARVPARRAVAAARGAGRRRGDGRCTPGPGGGGRVGHPRPRPAARRCVPGAGRVGSAVGLWSFSFAGGRNAAGAAGQGR